MAFCMFTRPGNFIFPAIAPQQWDVPIFISHLQGTRINMMADLSSRTVSWTGGIQVVLLDQKMGTRMNKQWISGFYYISFGS